MMKPSAHFISEGFFFVIAFLLQRRSISSSDNGTVGARDCRSPMGFVIGFDFFLLDGLFFLFFRLGPSTVVLRPRNYGKPHEK